MKLELGPVKTFNLDNLESNLIEDYISIRESLQIPFGSTTYPQM